MTFKELKKRHGFELFRLCLGDRKITPAGKGEFLTTAPYREDRHPSLTFNLEKGLWYDHALNEGGDVIDLFCRCRGLDRRAALRELNRLFGGEP